jgi:hypothetical protein
MANRAFTLPGLWANEAQTAIPLPPVQGVTYRNQAVTDATIENGWPFGITVDSSVINQFLYVASLLLNQLSLQGVLSWNAGTTYGAGALAIGSDGNLYVALQTSTNMDPTLYPAYWKLALGVADGSITTAKLAPGAVTAPKLSSVLGVNVGLSFGTSYQATSDGFVTAFGQLIGGTQIGKMFGYVGVASPPTIPIAASGISSGAGGILSLTFPVQKGQFWMVSVTEGAVSSTPGLTGVTFTPLGV